MFYWYASNFRTRLSSLSSNASNTSDHMTSSKNLPVSLTLSHNNKVSYSNPSNANGVYLLSKIQSNESQPHENECDFQLS